MDLTGYPITLDPKNQQKILDKFWKKQMEIIENTNMRELRLQDLPLARIKKIMKLDEDVKMISGEVPILFAKAAEIFISELTMRAWWVTEAYKRRTLQKSDVALAACRCDQFDFLVDIIPRDEHRSAMKRTYDESIGPSNTVITENNRPTSHNNLNDNIINSDNFNTNDQPFTSTNTSNLNHNNSSANVVSLLGSCIGINQEANFILNHNTTPNVLRFKLNEANRSNIIGTKSQNLVIANNKILNYVKNGASTSSQSLVLQNNTKTICNNLNNTNPTTQIITINDKLLNQNKSNNNSNNNTFLSKVNPSVGNNKIIYFNKNDISLPNAQPLTLNKLVPPPKIIKLGKINAATQHLTKNNPSTPTPHVLQITQEQLETLIRANQQHQKQKSESI